MASLVTASNGLRRIAFVAADGKRRTLRLGHASERDARFVLLHVENILSAASYGGALSPVTAAWLNDLDDTPHARLAAVGLVEPRDAAMLGPFLDAYSKTRGDVKPQTRVVWSQTIRCLKTYFGDNKSLRAISGGDASEWRAWLVGNEKLADGTVRRRTGLARQFFEHARRKGLLQTNPFDGLPAAVRGNADKFYFVSPEDADKVQNACPSLEWKLIFALARWGGLRIPSEALALKWGDIDWQRSRFKVTSPKTEHHPGHATRWVPLFPELATLLQQAFGEAPDRAVYVLTNPIWRARGGTLNLRKMISVYIERAGLTVWPKLWVNLRATRAIELRQLGFADHVVNAWLGHTADVAAEHYLRVTDRDFEDALVRQAARKAAREVHEPSGMEANAEPEKCDFPAENAISHSGQGCLMGAGGFEPPQEHTIPSHKRRTSGAQSGARGLAGTRNSPLGETNRGLSSGNGVAPDPELRAVAEAWPTLPLAVRAGILALVRATLSGE